MIGKTPGTVTATTDVAVRPASERTRSVRNRSGDVLMVDGGGLLQQRLLLCVAQESGPNRVPGQPIDLARRQMQRLPEIMLLQSSKHPEFDVGERADGERHLPFP